MKTVADLLKDLRPGGYVCVNVPGLPFSVYAQKTLLRNWLADLPADMPVRYVVENPRNTGHYESPRRTVTLRGFGKAAL